MITSLSYTNFKGRSRSYALGSATLIVGRNFSGKTAIDQAIRALVLGYVPGIKPETTAALKQFASDYPLEITADVAGRPQLGIRFEKVKSAVKQTRDDTITSSGGMDDPTSALFDPAIFFGLSDDARISKACELVQSQGGSADEIAAQIRAVLGDSIWATKKLTEWRLAVGASKVVNEILAESERFWKDAKAAENAEKSRMQKMAEGLTDLNVVESELSKLPPMHEAAETKRNLSASIHALTEHISAARAVANEAEARRVKIERLTGEVAKVEPAREAFDAVTDALRKAEAKWEEISRVLAVLRVERENAVEQNARASAQGARIASLKATAEREANIRAEIERLTKAIEDANARLEAAHQKANTAAAERTKASAEAEATPALPAGVGNFYENADPSCEYDVRAKMRFSDGQWRASVSEWTQVMTPEQEEADRMRRYDLQCKVEEASEAFQSATEAVAACEQEVAELNAKLDVWGNELKIAIRASAELAEIQPVVAVDLSSANASLDAAVRESSELNREVNRLREEYRTASSTFERLLAASRELAALKERPVRESATAEQISVWFNEREALNTKLQEVEAQITSITRLEQDRKRVREAAKLREEVEARVKLCGKVLDVIDQKRREVVCLAIEGPLAIANRLADGILRGPLVMEEGQIGMSVGGRFISSRLFSGTESAIVMMGLTAGLAVRSKLRVLLLDEFGRLDHDNARRLMRNLTSLRDSGEIDQWILIGPPNDGLEHAAATDNSSLTVIRVD